MLALAGAGSANAPARFPISWDFVDTSLCGYPIHSVGSGTITDHVTLPGDEYREAQAGVFSMTVTNALTGASQTFSTPNNFKIQADPASATFTLTGKQLGFGAGLPYGIHDGQETGDANTGILTKLTGTFAPIDLCSVLAPGQTLFHPRATPPPWDPPTAPLAGVYADGLMPIIGGCSSTCTSTSTST